MWLGVTRRFTRFHNDLLPTDAQILDANTKKRSVLQALERAYYGQTSDSPSGFSVGSWGKSTQVRPSADIDLFFPVPPAEYHRFNEYTGNKQSSFLADVRSKITPTFPQTVIRGDGQVVVINFNTITVEVVPAFNVDRQGNFYMPDTNDGGRWKAVNPGAEIHNLEQSDIIAYRNVRPMVRIMKVWKREKAVPLKSYQLELLLSEFLRNYAFRNQNFFYYDWFVRDFLAWLVTQANRSIAIPGTNELVSLGSDWLSKAQTAHVIAVVACNYERDDRIVEAGYEWQKMFGNRIPAEL